MNARSYVGLGHYVNDYLPGRHVAKAVLLALVLWHGLPDCLPAAEADSKQPPGTYSNPVIDEIGPADPHVIRHKGTYYLYPTGDNRSYRVYTSTDLVNWQRGPRVFEPGESNVWAPDVYYHPENGKFYLYYTVDQRVGVAVSQEPDTTFKNIKTFYPKDTIDAHLFRDDDGELYLYSVRFGDPFQIRVQPMGGPTEKEGELKTLIQPSQSWEEDGVTEGPWILKRNGRYYLMYSGSGANTPDYAIGYATSDSPTGPFSKYSGNPIVKRREGLYGPGHHCVVKDGTSQLWLVYHQKKSRAIAWDRFICIDRLIVDKQGRLKARATRGTPQPAPVPLNSR